MLEAKSDFGRYYQRQFETDLSKLLKPAIRESEEFARDGDLVQDLLEQSGTNIRQFADALNSLGRKRFGSVLAGEVISTLVECQTQLTSACPEDYPLSVIKFADYQRAVSNGEKGCQDGFAMLKELNRRFCENDDQPFDIDRSDKLHTKINTSFGPDTLRKRLVMLGLSSSDDLDLLEKATKKGAKEVSSVIRGCLDTAEEIQVRLVQQGARLSFADLMQASFDLSAGRSFHVNFRKMPVPVGNFLENGRPSEVDTYLLKVLAADKVSDKDSQLGRYDELFKEVKKSAASSEELQEWQSKLIDVLKQAKGFISEKECFQHIHTLSTSVQFDEDDFQSHMQCLDSVSEIVDQICEAKDADSSKRLCFGVILRSAYTKDGTWHPKRAESLAEDYVDLTTTVPGAYGPFLTWCKNPEKNHAQRRLDFKRYKAWIKNFADAGVDSEKVSSFNSLHENAVAENRKWPSKRMQDDCAKLALFADCSGAYLSEVVRAERVYARAAGKEPPSRLFDAELATRLKNSEDSLAFRVIEKKAREKGNRGIAKDVVAYVDRLRKWAKDFDNDMIYGERAEMARSYYQHLGRFPTPEEQKALDPLLWEGQKTLTLLDRFMSETGKAVSVRNLVALNEDQRFENLPV